MPQPPPSEERIDVDVVSARESVFVREREVFLKPPGEEGSETDPITLLNPNVEEVTMGQMVEHVRMLERRAARVEGVETREVTTPLPPPAE